MLEAQTDKNNVLSDIAKLNHAISNHLSDSNIDELVAQKAIDDTSSLEHSTVSDKEEDTSVTHSTSIPEPNCLALTVRKDYNLMIVKNIFTATGRLSWKIVLATVVLNFLRMMF